MAGASQFINQKLESYQQAAFFKVIFNSQKLSAQLSYKQITVM